MIPVAIRFHLYRLSLGGALSLIHLIAFALVTILSIKQHSDTAATLMMLLGLPLVIPCLASASPHGLDPNATILLVLLLPANSYLWGYTLAAFWKRSGGRRLSSRDRRIMHGQCPACGYDLRGSRRSDRYPECGEPIPERLRDKSAVPEAT